MFTVKILKIAQEDIQTIADYYSDISNFLTERFLQELKFNLESLKSFPKSHQIKYKQIRVSFVKGFPYGIYYKIYDKEIRVIAVVHTSRNPTVWKGR